jgi:predicted ABC-type sugar transport system permease subunit
MWYTLGAENHEMPWLLVAVVLIVVAAVWLRRWSRLERSEEPMPQLIEGGVRVAVRSVKVTGALTKADALSGLVKALPHLHSAVKSRASDGKAPSGVVAVSFRTEPDGMIRMILGGNNRLSGPDAKTIADEFAGSAMGCSWQFPASAGPSLIETEFVVGE